MIEELNDLQEKLEILFEKRNLNKRITAKAVEANFAYMRTGAGQKEAELLQMKLKILLPQDAQIVTALLAKYAELSHELENLNFVERYSKPEKIIYLVLDHDPEPIPVPLKAGCLVPLHETFERIAFENGNVYLERVAKHPILSALGLLTQPRTERLLFPEGHKLIRAGYCLVNVNFSL